MKKKYVLVETLSTFRVRYLVDSEDRSYAEQIIKEEDSDFSRLEEFSQQWLGQTIVSSRVISENKAIDLYREDNDYIINTSDESVRETLIRCVGGEPDDE